MIEAQVICDSISPEGKRLVTFKLRYPKFIHGEFMTHRVISRNASSSRAVPTAKLIEEVHSDALRAGPVFWGANQKGMQAAEELKSVTFEDDNERGETVPIHERFLRTGSPFDPLCFVAPKIAAMALWKSAAMKAAEHAEEMLRVGVHKQIVNRLLEPFSHINVVATATEWDNFFGLRLDKAAQPEMRALAVVMWEARKASTPQGLKPGQWHLPFVPDQVGTHGQSFLETTLLAEAIKTSVARSARVSYESFETGRRSTVEEDLKLYGRLLGAQPLHASPAEHQATPDQWVEPDRNYPVNNEGWQRCNEHGNLVGWRQYRKMLPGEAVAPLPAEFAEPS